ncbi:MAG TPA: SPOR domain-containing protein [Sphingomicrobium sp.]|nr:SPOR domain-containing protein [Sphingomicrobium sp.]
MLACAGAAALATAAPAAAQGSYSPYNESAADALARYVRALADDPKDFNSLIGAGRAALELGDSQAAAGFFARADEVNPRSPLPQAGMGAVQVENGDAKAALPYFARAQQLGATQVVIGCDRGLAYDLLGQQSKAQADYRAALSGADADEARRRLALSLAISGDQAGAIATIAPLSARGDSSVPRVRAFILALAGNSTGAMSAINAAMPGSGSRVAPFMAKLPSLPAGEKAAAVNLGIFPDSNSPAYAYAAPVRTVPQSVQTSGSVTTDRLADVDALLRSPSAPPVVQPVWQQPPLQQQPVQVAYAAPPRPSTVQRAAAADKRIWLQLASGSNRDALSRQFERMKTNHKTVFEGISGYVVQEADRARLVIGPFRGTSDAEILADDLHTLGIDAFRWTNSDSDRIVPIAGE